MSINRIVTFYDDGLVYAARLAKALQIRFALLTMSHSPASRLAKETGLPTITDQILTEIKVGLRRADCFPKQIDIIEYDGSSGAWSDLLHPNDLVVSNRHIAEITTHAVIMPQRETDIFRSGKESVLLSIGDDNLAQRTYRHGLHISKCLLPKNGWVTLYHTTWKDPRILSDDPFDHVSEQALRILNEAEGLGNDFEIAVHRMIRMDETVLHGIAEAALRSNAGLVVVARDRDVTIGDYAERLATLLADSIPILILPYHQSCQEAV